MSDDGAKRALEHAAMAFAKAIGGTYDGAAASHQAAMAEYRHKIVEALRRHGR
jgi:hypothetical protein